MVDELMMDVREKQAEEGQKKEMKHVRCELTVLDLNGSTTLPYAVVKQSKQLCTWGWLCLLPWLSHVGSNTCYTRSYSSLYFPKDEPQFRRSISF